MFTSKNEENHICLKNCSQPCKKKQDLFRIYQKNFSESEENSRQKKIVKIITS